MIQKNEWMLAHELAYEDEDFPISPALFLKKIASVLFGMAGVGILLLLFGNSVTAEREQQTWTILQTQPIGKWRLFFCKYTSVLLMTGLFIAAVIAIGVLPTLFHSQLSLHLNYPIVVTSGDTVSIISAGHYMVRSIVIFILAILFAFSLLFFMSNFVKNTFSLYMLTGLILLIGSFTASSPWNPFWLFHFKDIVAKAPGPQDGLTVIFSVSCSVLLFLLAIVLPERASTLFIGSATKQPFSNGKTQTFRSLILRLSQFEWRKIRRKPLTFQVVLTLAFLVTVQIFFIANQTVVKKETYLQEIEAIIVDHRMNRVFPLEQAIESFTKEKEKAEEEGNEARIAYYNDPASLELLHTKLENERDKVSLYENALIDYKKEEWIPFYKFQLAVNEEKRDQETTHRYFSPYTYAVSIAEKKWLMERNLRPVLSGEFTPTVYDQWGDNEELKTYIQSQNKKVDDSGLFSLYLNFKDFYYVVPSVIILFLVGLDFAEERGKRPTLHFLLTQPLRRRELFLGKVINNSLVGIGGSIAILGLLLFIGTISRRLGDWAYPVLHYDGAWFSEASKFLGNSPPIDDRFHLMELGNYVIKTSGLFLLILLFAIVLANLLALFIRSKTGVVICLLLIGSIGYIGSDQFLSRFAHLSPFTYLDVARISNGERAVLKDNLHITEMMGSLVLLCSIGLVLIIGWFIASKWDQ
ncbi:hypothetical protein NCCP2222_12810 [Sporosarcina sp. NCCP-2222]|nr:hypothetical protein NCCP2222_12810 [Sporosarcina sp. NCCP-2222]